MSSWYSEDEISLMGFASLGKGVLISRKAVLYGTERIAIGDHSRIDDFCVLSAGEGGIRIGRYVHVAVFCSLIGKGEIVLSDYAGLSSRVTIYSSSDDFSGKFMTNPTVPAEFTNVRHAPVTLGRHVIVGAAAVILPGAQLGEGAAVGAQALVRGVLGPFAIYAGVPARRVGPRATDCLSLEAELMAWEAANL